MARWTANNGRGTPAQRRAHSRNLALRCVGSAKGMMQVIHMYNEGLSDATHVNWKQAKAALEQLEWSIKLDAIVAANQKNKK